MLWKENPPVEDAEKPYRAINGWEVGFLHKRKDGTEFPVSISWKKVHKRRHPYHENGERSLKNPDHQSDQSPI